MTKRTMKVEKRDICCIQESEIPNLMNDKDVEYKDIETENSDFKKRVCTYIKNCISYKRR